MTTILMLNAVASLTAGAGLGAQVIRARRRARRDWEANLIYLTAPRR